MSYYYGSSKVYAQIVQSHKMWKNIGNVKLSKSVYDLGFQVDRLTG